MAKVRIVTDSTCDLPQELLENYHIKVVPLTVLFGEQAFRDRIDLSSQEFYQRLAAAKKLPTTSQPAPGAFAAVYQKFFDEGYSVLSIHISGGLSGTVRSAELGGQLVPGIDLHVIDSLTTSIGLGLLVLAAAQAAQQDKSAAEIVKLINKLIAQSNLYFLLDSLEYVYKGGRIGRASAFFGNLLNIKPILSFKDGVVTPASKVRSRNRAIDAMLDLVKKEVGMKKIRFAIAYGNNRSDALKLQARVQQEFQHVDSYISELSPVLGTYGGPGILGIGYSIAEV